MYILVFDWLISVAVLPFTQTQRDAAKLSDRSLNANTMPMSGGSHGGCPFHLKIYRGSVLFCVLHCPFVSNRRILILYWLLYVVCCSLKNYSVKREVYKRLSPFCSYSQTIFPSEVRISVDGFGEECPEAELITVDGQQRC